MAAPTRILTLSLGTQTVGLAEFKVGPNGTAVLSSYHTRELLADPAADSTRIAQANLLLKELVQSLKLRGTKISYAVSSQSVFTRFVKLPSVGEEQVDQIVTFEAQQNVPYPINEVVWDYQLVDSGDPSQVEVVIVAVKADLLDDINDAVETAGLKTTIVDVAPMAVYNAFRYNYSELGGCSLIIDIGSRSTNLIFIEPHKVFSRSIPNGGSAITQAIAKDFGEPFGLAEERKKRDGFVSLGGAYAEPEDPDVARVSKMIRNTMTRLHAEIARSISFYRAQQGGTQPERIFLCGGSTTLPYMREFFTEKLQLPVEFFNPLRNVAVTSGISAEEISRSAHRLGELVGLALRGTSECPMEMNLRPKKVVRRHELAKRRPYIILAGVGVLALMAGWWQYFDHATAVVTDAAEKVSQQSVPLQSLEKAMDKARLAIKGEQDTVAPLLTAVDDRSYWVRIIDDVNSRLPKEFVWVTSFGPVSADKKGAGGNTQGPKPPNQPGGGPGGLGGQRPAAGGTILLLKGLYLSNPRQALVVDDFLAKLKGSDLYEVDEKNLKRSVPNESEWAYDFQIPLILKTPIKLSAAELVTSDK